MMVYPDLFRRKQKFYAKHVITPFERKMFIRLKEAFPRHHVLAQVSFSSLITSDHYKCGQILTVNPRFRFIR